MSLPNVLSLILAWIIQILFSSDILPCLFIIPFKIYFIYFYKLIVQTYSIQSPEQRWTKPDYEGNRQHWDVINAFNWSHKKGALMTTNDVIIRRVLYLIGVALSERPLLCKIFVNNNIFWKLNKMNARHAPMIYAEH